MSTLELKTGYHHIEVNPADRYKTAFVCPFGTFRYKRMPFDLRNTPATFQRLMDQFRNGLPTHIPDLKFVFERLQKFKLCVNREQCKFACARVKYLGLWITPKGIEVNQVKVAAIQNIPCPRNVKQLQSFLQTYSWYRKFIPNFSDIARHLSNLKKKNILWKWSEQEQQDFQTLKQCLVTQPVLKKVDPTKPFIIKMDASVYALGAVLLQGESPADERPIKYASRLLSSAEKNCSTTEREALAVTNATLWLTCFLDLNHKDICELKNIVIDVPSRTAAELKTEQLKDSELQKIIDCFEDIDKRVDFANWTQRGYVLNQEYSIATLHTLKRKKLTTHYGADGTFFFRISSRYYWTGMRKFITDYVKNCADCIRYKATNQKPAGLIQTHVPAQRFESIAIDLFGPLPETSEDMKSIFIVEDCTTKWVELFPLKQATAKELP
ncbi:Retrovirus-related Pol polyprotein like [Argiope bruennichi]|uniref:RNA-directed DNA polymerase n=1 Tax=Argiope bruennichi TaxID=94029 RepID=A0A8T0FQT6_ARGBR|nr:Retrovirus-related Pol polyprotein like [Argiope bruennichi]